MQDTSKGFIYMLVGVSLYSALSIMVKIIYSMGITETTLTPLFALLVFLISFFYNIAIKRDKLKVKKKEIKYLLLQGIIGVAFVNMCFNKSLLYIDASLAIMILYLSCVFIFLFKKIVRKSKFTINSIIYMSIVIIGLIIATNPNTSGKFYNIKGLIFAFTASCCYAFLNVNLEENLSEIDSTIIIMYTQFIALVLLLLLYKPSNVFNLNITYINVIILFVMAFTLNFLPMLFIMKGVNKLGAYKSSVIGTLELPFTALFAFAFIKETMSLMQIIGMILVIIGAIKIKNT